MAALQGLRFFRGRELREEELESWMEGEREASATLVGCCWKQQRRPAAGYRSHGTKKPPQADLRRLGMLSRRRAGAYFFLAAFLAAFFVCLAGALAAAEPSAIAAWAAARRATGTRNGEQET